MSHRLKRPLTQIGTGSESGQRHVTSIDLPYIKQKIDSDPKFREAMELSRLHGYQFREDPVTGNGKILNSAIEETLFKNSRSARLHEQEQNAAAVLRAKEKRSAELALHN